jgi:hypothetical protein
VGKKPFLIQKCYDEDGEELTRLGDERRFMEGRAGDHMMAPFQCPLCHFRNMMKRDPWDDDEMHQEIQEFVVSAILDTFWGRETTTVTKNLSEVRRMERTFSRLRMPSGTSIDLSNTAIAACIPMSSLTGNGPIGEIA